MEQLQWVCQGITGLIMKNGVNNSVVFMLIILPEHGQVMPYMDTLGLMILEIGIGVIILMVFGTANHLIIMEHSVTSSLASLA